MKDQRMVCYKVVSVPVFKPLTHKLYILRRCTSIWLYAPAARGHGQYVLPILVPQSVHLSLIWCPLNKLSSNWSKSFKIYTQGQGPKKKGQVWIQSLLSFSVLELYPCLLYLIARASMFYGHILTFFAST